MGSGNSKLEDIKIIPKLLKQTIKDLGDGVKSMAGFDLIEQAVEQLLKASTEFSHEEKKALQCIIDANKKIAIAVDQAKNVVSDVKSLCTTLNNVINSNTKSNVDKMRVAISVFKKRMNTLLDKIEKARDWLTNITSELEATVVEITHLKSWSLGKKQELENAKNLAVAKERGAAYGGAAGTTVAVAGTVAAVFCWNPIGLLAGKVAAGAAAGSTVVTFAAAAGVAEGATIPQLEKMYDDGIKGMEESAKQFEEMSKRNKERTKNLKENVMQLREIGSVAREAHYNAEGVLEFDAHHIMFNILKEDVKELERLCDNYLTMNFVS